MEAAMRAYYNLGIALPWEESARTLDCFEKGFELAKRAGAIRWVSSIGTVLASIYVGMGNMKRTVLLAEESIALDRKAGNMPNLSHSLRHLGVSYLILGEWDNAEQYLNEALNLAQRLDQFRQIAYSTYYLGILYGVYKGEYAKAEEFLEKTVGKFEKAEAKFEQMYVSTILIWIYIESGKLPEADGLISSVHKFALETKDNLLTAVAEILRGTYFRVQKKWEEAIEHFENSRGFECTYMKQWGVYHFAKWYLSGYARVFLERDQEGDGERAKNLLTEALEIFQKMGAKKEAGRTKALVEALHVPLTQIDEGTVSPESHEYAELRGNIIASPDELKVGESLELEIELTNTCKKGTILLTKIIDVIPEGFTMVKKPELYRMEGNCLNMKEKRLDPSTTEEVKLVLTPKIQGTFHIKPKILYIDANGKEKTHEPKPASITVKELGIKGWLKGER
jgi:tetratricopeptide (TPR) repeat protein